MDWKHDPEVMESLDRFLLDQKETLFELLNNLHEYNDGSPIFMFTHLWGLFVEGYSKHRGTLTETDALDLVFAEIANHPLVANMVANMMGKTLDRAVGKND